MRKAINILAAAALAMAAGACGRSPSSQLAGEGMATAVRLDSMIYFDGESQAFLADSSLIEPLRELAAMSGRSGESVGDFVREASASSAYRVFGPDVMERFATLAPQLAAYGRARAIGAELLPGLEIPDTLLTIISPYRQSVVISPSGCFVALNHYLGSDYEGYQGFAPAVRRLKTPERLPVEVVEAMLRSSLGETSAPDMTLAAQLFQEGAIYYALSQLLPEAPLGDILGFSPEQMRWLDGNEAALWNAIVGHDLLFSTNPALAGRLLEAPTPARELPEGAPERAGRYVGYRLAAKLMQREKGLSLSELLAPSTATDPGLLQRVAYQP